MPQSQLAPREFYALTGPVIEDVERFDTVFHDRPRRRQDDGDTRVGLLGELLTLQPHGARALLGVSGVTVLGAALWLAMGMRADRRARQLSARTRGLLVALGQRPVEVRRSLMAWTMARTAVSALSAAALAALVAFPPVVGYRAQAAVVLVLASYLLLVSVPQFIWAAVRQRRDLRVAIDNLHVVEE